MLGDALETALSAVGVTTERVERWLGKPCHCAERKEKLNQLSNWAARVMKGKTKGMVNWLEEMIGGS